VPALASNTFSTWTNAKRRKKPRAAIRRSEPIFPAIAALIFGGAT